MWQITWLWSFRAFPVQCGRLPGFDLSEPFPYNVADYLALIFQSLSCTMWQVTWLWSYRAFLVQCGRLPGFDLSEPFPWCGLNINTGSLEVSVDYSRYSGLCKFHSRVIKHTAACQPFELEHKLQILCSISISLMSQSNCFSPLSLYFVFVCLYKLNKKYEIRKLQGCCKDAHVNDFREFICSSLHIDKTSETDLCTACKWLQRVSLQ